MMSSVPCDADEFLTREGDRQSDHLQTSSIACSRSAGATAVLLAIGGVVVALKSANVTLSHSSRGESFRKGYKPLGLSAHVGVKLADFVQIKNSQGLCLDAGGQHIHLWPCNISNFQQLWVPPKRTEKHRRELMSVRGSKDNCSDGSDVGCECMLGCEVFGGASSKCAHKSAAERKALAASRIAKVMADQHKMCRGMQCIMECGRSLGCLSAKVQNDCKTFQENYNLHRSRHDPSCYLECEEHKHSSGLFQTGEFARKCMDNGGSLHMWPCAASNPNQMWHVDDDAGLLVADRVDSLDDAADGASHQRRSSLSSTTRLCLAADGIVNLQECNAANVNQRWSLNPVKVELPVAG